MSADRGLFDGIVLRKVTKYRDLSTYSFNNEEIDMLITHIRNHVNATCSVQKAVADICKRHNLSRATVLGWMSFSAGVLVGENADISTYSSDGVFNALL